MGHNVAVYGASGHTGGFVVAELEKRGHTAIRLGRENRSLNGADAVINCAGPFAVTAGPMIAEAIRVGVPYVDVAAEIEANADTFARFSSAPIPIVPAMAFFGGLGDLLVTAAMGDWTTADEAHVAYGLSGWQPTSGTLAAGKVSGERRGGRRVRFSGGLQYHDDPLPTLTWDFPTGPREVIGEFSMADIVTVPSHLAIPSVTTYMAASAAQGLASGASREEAETFEVDVVVRRAGEERRMAVSGKDIYAVTAPLAVEAVERLLTGRGNTTGVASAGAMFDAADFLAALSGHITPARRCP